MGKILLHIKKRLYIYVTVDFALALMLGLHIDFKQFNIKAISLFAVFLMLYPMLTGLVVEKVRKAGRNIKLISLTLVFAFFVASGTAWVLSQTVFAHDPELALGIILVGAIPCSNMLIGWSGLADASVEDALVIAVVGLLLIPVLSPVLVRLSHGPGLATDTVDIIKNLLVYVLVPLSFGFITRRTIIKRKGMPYFMNIKKYLPGFSACGILVIVFFSVARVAPQVITNPIVFLQVAFGLFIYYLCQTILAVGAAKLFRLDYSRGMILILGATASSQAISLALAATLFGGMTVFALSFKPILQVLYIMFLIYVLGPRIRRFLNASPSDEG